ncbi:MAG: DNA primase [Gammaproteobacteria bacterium]|nr:DNA primase [Gammaproteobacteria bacterium]MBU1416392.1 DNA primase [Gammaproteobacteria bacterium]
MIPESFIQELLARVDIVDVVERYVPLKKGGANYQACCPFHSEKTPSFTVSPSKQFYHCFGCGAHGSALGFLMQYSGLGFIEAVEELAQSVGMPVPRVSERVQNDRAKKAPLTELMLRAARFYKDQLKASPKAIDYLKGRGLTGEIAARFGLGYAPDDWQGLQQVFPDYEDTALVECGLVIVNEQGRRYDRFRDRIMFPILDQRGNVIAFGGRIIGQGEPKYLNSPETPLFEKGRELYGLVQARQAIRDEDAVVVVEGYMDVVALAQHGVGNAVATLGTATTTNHVHRLLRQASKVVFCFDGDAAGRKAAWRALEACLDQLADDKSAGFLFLPPEHDPDSFVRAEGAETFRTLFRHPTTLTEFLLRELKAGVDLATAEGRARLVHEAKPHLQRLSATVLRVQLTKSIAEAAALTQAEVEAQCGLKPLARGRAAPPPRRRTIEISQLKTLLKAVLHRPERAGRLPLAQIDSESAEGATLHAIADAIEHGELAGGNMGQVIEHFRGSLHEPLIASLAASAATEEIDSGEDEAVFEDVMKQLRKADLSARIAELNAKADLQGGILTPDQKAELVRLLAAKTRQVAG